MGAVARRFHLGGHIARHAPRLSLPGKLVFPSNHNVGRFSMLGLGDIVMPGLLLCFVMRYDAYKRAQVKTIQDTGSSNQTWDKKSFPGSTYGGRWNTVAQ